MAATEEPANDNGVTLVPVQVLHDDDDDVRTVAVLALAGHGQVEAPMDAQLERYARALIQASGTG